MYKGEMVKKLQELFGVIYEEMMFFGDGENDVEFMGIVKYSFVVSNVCENIKKVVCFIIKFNEENGVFLII